MVGEAAEIVETAMNEMEAVMMACFLLETATIMVVSVRELSVEGMVPEGVGVRFFHAFCLEVV